MENLLPISGCCEVQTEPVRYNPLEIQPSKPERVWSYGWRARKMIWNREFTVLLNCGYCHLNWTARKEYMDGTGERCPYCNVLNILVPCEGEI